MKNQTDFVTQAHFNWKWEELQESMKQLHSKFDNLFEKIDWFIKKYEKIDQEQNLASKKISELGDRMDHVEKRVGIVN